MKYEHPPYAYGLINFSLKQPDSYQCLETKTVQGVVTPILIESLQEEDSSQTCTYNQGLIYGGPAHWTSDKKFLVKTVTSCRALPTSQEFLTHRFNVPLLYLNTVTFRESNQVRTSLLDPEPHPLLTGHYWLLHTSILSFFSSCSHDEIQSPQTY